MYTFSKLLIVHSHTLGHITAKVLTASIIIANIIILCRFLIRVSNFIKFTLYNFGFMHLEVHIYYVVLCFRCLLVEGVTTN